MCGGIPICGDKSEWRGSNDKWLDLVAMERLYQSLADCFAFVLRRITEEAGEGVLSDVRQISGRPVTIVNTLAEFSQSCHDGGSDDSDSLYHHDSSGRVLKQADEITRKKNFLYSRYTNTHILAN